MLDLKQHLQELATFISTEGIGGTHRFDQPRMEAAVQVLFEAIQYEDAGYRALGMSMGLRLLSQSLEANPSPRPRPARPGELPSARTTDRPPPPPPSAPVAPSIGPQAPMDDRVLPLACPTCNTYNLEAKGNSYPMPVICRNCGKNNTIT